MITTVSFLAGVSALVETNDKVVLAGIAQIAAGTIAIFFGAFISTKAQKDFFENQIAREKLEIERMPQKETKEICDIFKEYGFDEAEQEAAVRRITKSKDLWLKFMVQSSTIVTLILGVRVGISSAPRHRGLRAQVGKWDSHHNLGPSALGCETDRSAQHGRSLSHALNAQAVRGDRHDLGVKATSVIDDCDIQSRGQTR